MRKTGVNAEPYSRPLGETMNDMPPRRLKRMAQLIAAVGLCGWFSAFGYFTYLESYSPSVPTPELRKTERIESHGHQFYVTRHQEEIFLALLYGPCVTAGLAVASICMERPWKPKREA